MTDGTGKTLAGSVAPMDEWRPVVVSLGHTEATYEDGTRALSW